MQGSKRYSGFDPRTVGGCALWLDAADPSVLTLSGSAVTQWNDKSGRGNHATQSTAGNRPVYLPSARSVGFTATSAQFMNLPNGTLPIGNNSYAYFLVCSFNTLADIRGLIGGGGYGTIGAVFALRSGGSGMIHQYWWGRDVTTPVGVYSAAQQLIVGATYTSGGTRATLVDGVVRASDVPQARIQTAVNNTIGTTFSTEYHDGTISEVLVFDASLSVSERQQVEGYLAWKWGSRRITDPTITLAPEFNPLAIGTTPTLWLDGADPSVFTLSGSNVTQWRDKSGLGNHATGVNNPIWNSTSRRVEFSGSTNQYMSNSSYALNLSQRSIFIIMEERTRSNFAGVFSLIPNPSNQADQNSINGLAVETSGNGLRFGQQGASYASVIGNASLLPLAIYNDNMNGLQGSSFLNGSNVSNVVATTSATTCLGYITGHRWQNGPANPFNGFIYEILIYDTPLTTVQRQTVELYLSRKWLEDRRWGLPLVHPYYLRQPILRPFNPLDVEGCALWLDAADPSVVTESGGFVTAVVNKGSTGLVLSNATGFTYNRAARSFSNSVPSSSAILGRNSTYTQNQPGTFIAVAAFSSSASNPYLIDSRSTEGLVGRFAYSVIRNAANTADVGYAFAGNGVSPDFGLRTAGNIASNTPIIHTLLMNNTASDVRVNGVTQTFTQSPGTNSMTGITVANRYTDDQSWVGSINELLLYNRGLSLNERQQVEAYLAAKWGLRGQTPSTHLARLSPGLTPQFNPLNVGSCALWLDGADPLGTGTLPANNSSLSTWRDKSGNGRTMTATSAPTYNATTGEVVFNGISNAMSNTTNIPTTTQNYPTFVVLRPAVTTRGRVIGITVNGQSTISQLDTTFINSSTPSSNSFVGPLTVTAGARVLYQSFANTAADIRYAINGTVNNNWSGADGASTQTVNSFIIGGVPTVFYNGTLCEVIVFNAFLTTSQRQQVEGYLARKWGLLGTLQGPTLTVAREFNPLAIGTAPALWFDAADATSLTLSGSNVTQWRDKSGNNRHAAQSTTSNQPVRLTNAVGTNSVISFVGSNFLSGVLPVNGLTDMTAFFVQKPNENSTDSGRIIGWTDAGSWGQVYFGDTQQRISWRFGTGQVNNAPFYTNPSPSSTYRILNVTKRGTTETVVLNGTTVATHTAGNTTIANTANEFAIGYLLGAGANQFGRYEIGEILIFTSQLTVSQRQQVETYLGAKWGLSASLPQPTLTLPPSFTPVSVPQAALWLDAADSSTVTLSGSNVTAWADKSGNGRHVTSVVSPVYVTNTINSLPAVRFSNSYMQSPVLPLFSSSSSGGSFFFIFRTTNNSAQSFLLTYPNQTSGVYCQTESEIGIDTGNQTGNGNFGLHRGCSSATIAPANTIATNTVYMMGVILLTTGTSPSNVNIYQNGNLLSVSNDNSGYYSAGSYPSGNSARTLNLGGRANIGATADGFFAGDIAEVLWYPQPLTTTERQTVEAYLARKWGLQNALPAAHPFQSPFASTHPYKMTPLL